MTDAEPNARRSPWTPLWLAVQRERALIALFELGQTGIALRLARLSAFWVMLGYGLAISLAGGAHQRATIHGYLAAALGSLSWLVGALAALGAARALAGPADRDALAALALQRGVRHRSLGRARVLASAARIARLIAVPSLLLVLLGVIRGCSLPWALSVAPAVIVYAALLGLGLSALSYFSAQLAPRRPRALLAVLVLCPWLISQAFPAFPNVPLLLASVLRELLSAGAELS